MMRWLGPCILAALASAACGESRLLDDFTEQATRLRLAPESFRGDVPCLRGTPGALQMYAVTFHQVQEVAAQRDAGLLHETSDPVPCDRAVLLTAIPFRPYVADIYGFDRIVSAPAPLNEARWTAHCGRGDGVNPPDAGGRGGPTLAVYGEEALMVGCTALQRVETPAGETQLVIDQASALGALRCGNLPGQVSRLEGVLEGTRVSAACGNPLAFAVASEARAYSIDLVAYEASQGTSPPVGSADPLDASLPPGGDAALDGGLDAGILDAGGGGSTAVPDAASSDAGSALGVARWRTQCSGTAVPGTSAVATCDPLAPLPSGG